MSRALVLGSLWGARFLVEELGGTVFLTNRQGLFGWDATWYRLIAEQGYDALDVGGLRFFPLVPLAARALGVVFLGNTALALAVIVNASALVMAALIHRIMSLETGDDRMAGRATWFALVVPSGATLVMGYAEATFMMLVAGAFLSYRTRHWGWGAGLGLLAALCRPSGLLLTVPAAVETVRNWRGRSPRQRAASLLSCGGPAVGATIYLGWSAVAEKGFWTPFSVQSRETLRGGTEFPPSRVLRAMSNLLVDGDRFHSGRYLVWIAIFTALLVVLARRMPSCYVAYGACAMVLALSATNLESLERYGMGALVLALGLPLVTERVEWERALLVASAGGLVAYSFLLFSGPLIP